jgi:predicted GNAT family acetyltransferase
MAKELTHEPDANRYVLRINGDIIAVADYRVNGNQISFTHTFTNPAQRGKGYAAEVVTFAIDDVEKNTTYKVVPMCWYVAEWFDDHTERAALLSR